MGKLKVHELAKELGMQSKELVDKLTNMGYDVKSHLSTLEDSEVKEIKNKMKKDDSNTAPEKVQMKKEKKPIAPVIIRREVTRIENTSEEKVAENRVDRRDDLGVVQRRTNTTMNIKYRTEPRKIGTINSTISNKKEQPKVDAPEVKEEKKPQVVETPIENKIEKKIEEKVEVKSVAPVKEEKAVETKVENKPTQKTFDNNRNRNNFNNNNNRNYNNQNNRNNNNNGGNNNFQRNNRNNENRPQYNNNRSQRPQENKVEKGIKEIMSNVEMPVKEPVRETLKTGYKDKQKDNRKFEEDSKKNTKNKQNKSGKDNINFGKLRDLQTESNFSNMFNDTESKMFDYYDLSKEKGFKKNKKKIPTESKNHIEQKIFELTDIDIPETITVKDLAEKLKKQASEIIKKLMGYGVLATLNQELDYDTAYLVASEFGVNAHKKEVVTDEDILFDETDDREEDLVPRPPIVVVM